MKTLNALLLLALLCGAALAQERGVKKQVSTKIVLPTYKQAWQVEVPDWANHLGVGDVTGDKKPRLLLSNRANRLTVYRLEKSTLKQESAIELGTKGERFVIGRFLKGKPEAIVVAGAVFHREGAEYVRIAVPEITSVNGNTRYADGTEEVLQWEPTAPPQTWAFGTSKPESPKVGQGIRPPKDSAGFLKLVVIRGTPEFLAQLDAGDDFVKAGVIGNFDPRGDGEYYLWAPKITADGSFFTVSSVEGKPVWKSDKLDGKILDVAMGDDPEGTKQKGVFLLLAHGADGKARSVLFLALEVPAR